MYLRRHFLVLAFWFALMAGSLRLQAAFTGDYDEAAWTFRNYGGEGTADWLTDSVLIDSGYSGSGSLAQSDLTLRAPRTGTYYFSWVFYGGTTTGYRLSWLRNNTTSSLVMRKDYAEGAESFYVNAGDTVGFRITSPLNEFPAMAEIYAFFAPGQEPSIVEPPKAQIGCQGNVVVFSVTATNATDYQWQFKGQNLPEEVFEDLVLRAVPPADSGNYRVVIRNPLGSVTSQAVPLTILYPPAFTIQPPASTVACAGQTVTLSASTTGTSLRYQWQRNGVNLTGASATNATLTLANVSPSISGQYTLVLANGCGQVSSAPATLEVSAPPSIATPPATQTRYAGESATFSVALATPTPATYQWRRNGTNLAGATQPTLTLPVVQTADAGAYSVLVQNACGSSTSANATLAIAEAPPGLRIVRNAGSTKVSIEVTGIIGRLYVLESSHDLQHWTPTGTNGLVISGSALFSDSTEGESRFYRVRPAD